MQQQTTHEPSQPAKVATIAVDPRPKAGPTVILSSAGGEETTRGNQMVVENDETNNALPLHKPRVKPFVAQQMEWRLKGLQRSHFVHLENVKRVGTDKVMDALHVPVDVQNLTEDSLERELFAIVCLGGSGDQVRLNPQVVTFDDVLASGKPELAISMLTNMCTTTTTSSGDKNAPMSLPDRKHIAKLFGAVMKKRQERQNITA